MLATTMLSRPDSQTAPRPIASGSATLYRREAQGLQPGLPRREAGQRHGPRRAGVEAQPGAEGGYVPASPVLVIA